MLQPSMTKIRLKITYLKFHSNFPGANELMQKRRNSIANALELHLSSIKLLIKAENKSLFQGLSRFTASCLGE